MVKVTITGAPGYGGFGESLLEKLGWSSGKGLGKNEDGVAEALRPKKKEDQAGVRSPRPCALSCSTRRACSRGLGALRRRRLPLAPHSELTRPFTCTDWRHHCAAVE